ncbi:MAG: hypothetical protein IPI12_04240 [Ignavibacteriales bacterium]|nr:hypothetical protein [Ignavibacteriales bacterium]
MMNDDVSTSTTVEAIVLGASAGGLNAMIELFSNLPVDLPVPILLCNIPARMKKAFSQN